jgi:pimeloyl-ACP methyl ester carboxylesterase
MVRGRSGLIVTEKELEAVRVPTVAIVGSLDPNLAGVKALKKLMPSLDVVVIEGAGHGPSCATWTLFVRFSHLLRVARSLLSVALGTHARCVARYTCKRLGPRGVR